MILLELHQGLIERKPVISAEDHGGWRLLSPCTADDHATCGLFIAAADFDQRDYEDFLSLLTTIFTLAKSTKPWESMMDKDRLHDLGKVKITRKDGSSDEKAIFQFKKRRTAIRVVFCYTGGRRLILLTQAFAKREAKFPPNERATAARIVDDFYRAVDEERATLVTAQGGRNAFTQLYSR